MLAYPLAKILNLSVKLFVFPEECKIAKLKPLFKKGSKTDRKNYRTACSVQNHWGINTFSVIRLSLKNGLLYKYQSGFRANFSTDSCLAQLTDLILIYQVENYLCLWMIFVGGWNLKLWYSSGIYSGTTPVFGIY